MTVTPNMVTDLSECKNVAAVATTAVSKISELMQLHGIMALNRYRSTGRNGAPVVRDVVTAAEFDIPDDLAYIRDAVGKALLNYVECLGMSGLTLSTTEDDNASLAKYWASYRGGTAPVSTEPVSADLNLDGLTKDDVNGSDGDSLDPIVVEADA